MKDDTISRQAAIDELSLYAEMLMRVLDDLDVVGNEREKYTWGLGVIEECIKDMKELPSAQPEQRHGKWIMHQDGSGTCDQCRIRQIAIWDFDGWQNFCGHCGADMRGNECKNN